MIKELSEKEKKILNFIKQKVRNISEVSKALNLDYKNAHRYCTKLKDLGFIRIEPPNSLRKKGKPLKLFFNDDKEVTKYTLIILKEIKKLGGEISFLDFMNNLPKTIKQTQKNLDQIVKAKALLSMHFNPYLQEMRKLTNEGKQLIKQNGNQKNNKT